MIAFFPLKMATDVQYEFLELLPMKRSEAGHIIPRLATG